MKDFFLYQIGTGIYAVTFSAFVLAVFYFSGMIGGIVDITHLSFLSQVVILYFFSESVIYLAHWAAHRYHVPILSKAHSFHHTVTTDMDWVNGRKEHLFVISLFMVVYCTFFFVVFKTASNAHIVTIFLYVTLNAFSHYRIPLTVKYFDQVFLFPKDHLRHHTAPSGPYGVTLSIFDTIFDTRDDVRLKRAG